MKLYTLGTSHGATEPGRSCSANLIILDGVNYLFDCGCSVESKMTDLGLPIDATRAAFLSHMHEDHVGGLSAIVKRFVHYHPNAQPLQVYFPEQQGLEGFTNWIRSMHFSDKTSQRAYFFCTQPGECYRDDLVTVTAIPTQHFPNGCFPSYAYELKSADKRLLFTGDLSSDFHDFPDITSRQDYDAVVCELVHFKLETALPKLLAVRTKHLIFSHVSPYMIPRLEEVRSRFPFPVTIATDGACFDI